jgi:hypothetical protein
MKGIHMNSVKLLTSTLVACAFLATAAPALAQPSANVVTLQPSDIAAAASATHRFVSATNKSTPEANTGKIRTDIGEPRSGGGGGSGGGVRYPADLINQSGVTLLSAVQHTLYLVPNGSACNAPACWGNADQFIHDLGLSDFIHVTDQYVGSSADHRYPYAGFALIGKYALPANPLTDNDMAAWAHAAAAFLGGKSGYGHVYHIFLAPEQNVCFDTTYTICSSNYFCGYHSSAVFSDGTEVIYTVEPYNLGPGCSVKPGTPNGAYDATYNTLSHEIFETITDPEGSAWWNSVDNGIYGEEIGDECSFITFAFSPAVYFDPSAEWLNGHRYAVQPEYNNAEHACTTHP